MEREQPDVILSWKEYHRLIEIEDVFTSLSLSHNDMKNEVNKLEQEVIDLRIAGQKLGGILQNIRHHTDYLPTFYYEQIDEVFNATDEIISQTYDQDETT